jgi:hypothetical protein
MTDLDLLDADTGSDFFAPVSTDAISGMVAQYDAMRQRIERIADMVAGENEAAISYFLDGNADRGSRWAAPGVARLFDRAGAVAALNSAYWSKALQLTDVLDLMPQARRDEWHKAITEHQTPDFCEETARNTLADLIAMRAKFFAERVDGIFRSLSGEHVTNRPEGFGKRMIVARVLTDFGGVDYSRAGLINDLRAVVAKFMGRDEPRHGSTEPLIRRLKGQWGEWVPVDGGALRIRLYRKGTAHLEVHPDMAWRLNQILASLYPLAIPPEFRAKPRRRVRDFDLIRRPLPFQVVNALASMQEATTMAPESERRDWRDTGLRTLPKTRAFNYATSKDAIAEAERVLEAIGGVKQPAGHWQFDYEPDEVLSEIVVSGCIPDHRSHQFYPTPKRLAERLVELAGIEPHHTVLEPSAGLGGLADLLPRERTTCVEISPLHAKVLEAKGHRVSCADFLALHTNRALYDRVVMNPPFSEGRWQAHIEHAAAMLADKGRLVAILPAGAKNRDDLLPSMVKEWLGPFDGEFAGTSVSVVMLAANR